MPPSPEVHASPIVMSLLASEGFSRFSWTQSNKRSPPTCPPCFAVRLPNTNDHIIHHHQSTTTVTTGHSRRAAQLGSIHWRWWWRRWSPGWALWLSRVGTLLHFHDHASLDRFRHTFPTSPIDTSYSIALFSLSH